MKKQEKTERNRQIVEKYKTGDHTMEDLATQYGISKARVGQILGRAGVHLPGRAKVKRGDRVERLFNWLKEYKRVYQGGDPTYSQMVDAGIYKSRSAIFRALETLETQGKIKVHREEGRRSISIEIVGSQWMAPSEAYQTPVRHSGQDITIQVEPPKPETRFIPWPGQGPQPGA